MKSLRLKDKTKVKGKKENSKQNEVQGKSSKKNDSDFTTKCTIQAGKDTRMKKVEYLVSCLQSYIHMIYKLYGLLFCIATLLKDEKASDSLDTIADTRVQSTNGESRV